MFIEESQQSLAFISMIILSSLLLLLLIGMAVVALNMGCFPCVSGSQKELEPYQKECHDERRCANRNLLYYGVSIFILWVYPF
jgi:hypothetical protein